MKILSNHPTEILILLFLIVTFMQSGNNVPLLLAIILTIEIVAGIFMMIGIYQIYASGLKEFALIGVELSAVALIFLLIGQRLAKDYAGAMTLAVYFIITLLGVFLLHS
jgi:putative oxidoreductase